METTHILIIPIILTSLLIIASHRKTHNFMTTQMASKMQRKKPQSVNEKILLLNMGHISFNGKKY